ncbi:MAG: FG-GAP repeat protein [Verrucomicrobia bacterium ADurb.Bin006]|nr:MAG: FG-GAP repeat protein [Verrucomicrobia bacterium ADurb.Bin006]
MRAYENTLKQAVRTIIAIALCALVSIAGWAGRAADDQAEFGFQGPEIFPIDNLISLLRAADFDGDGAQDLIVVNNARSKINILFNRAGKTNDLAPQPIRREINELPPDARFRIESLASEKTISALVVTDLNKDQRPDLAFFGTPKELVVQYNEGGNTWSAPRRWSLEDGLLDPNALTSGDLNGDGLEDLLMLGESTLYFLAQKPDHTLAEPEKIPYSGVVKAAQIIDIDGDGRSDLMLVNWEHANPFRFRLQTAAGQLGPEVHFTLPAIRSYAMKDLDGDKKTEVMTIAAKSGRAQISNFILKPAEALTGDFSQGQFQVIPFAKTTKNRRGIAWADVSGDGLSDLLVAEPDSGQVSLFLQQPDGSLAAPRTFPTFTGVSELDIADWDGDGRAEIFFLSADERQIGVSRLDEAGRIAFPTLIPIEGRPLTMAAGRVRADQNPLLTAIVDVDGKRELWLRAADGAVTRQKLSETFKSNPSSLTIHDLNHDGLPDLVVLIPYEKVKVLLQGDTESFDEQDVAPPGGSAEQPWLSAADVDGDGKAELLLAQKNFVRAVVLQADAGPKEGASRTTWTFRVKEQINGASSSSRIVGAASLQNGTNEVASLFLLDAERKALTLCERDPSGVWQALRNVPLPVTDFTALEAVALGGDRANAVLFLGLNSVAWLPLRGMIWEFSSLDDYETPIKDGFLHDVVPGDLNHDGCQDLVFLETAKNYLDIVRFEPPHRLVPANRWQVFEERTFRSRRPEIPEPREALIADLTGDGKNDLVVVVHDRILVYPQE